MMKRQTKTAAKIVRKGFTLTELLIVMAILVLLVSLVGPRLLGSKAKADINAVKTQIGMFQSSLERYAIDVNRFPSSEQGLAALVAAPSPDSGEGGSEMEEDVALEGDDEDGIGGSTSWDGPYIKTETLPKDPWGNSYRYEYPPTHNKMNVPDIWSFGPDGQENTDDDVVSWTGDGTSGEGGEGGVGESMSDEDNAI
ncbi:MAG: prepilin-type N-terminal cleavage/methylation domain-containing protein [Fuerstiella sp.]|nr:prepilin-type N-terminal cleavage/methylation domain-containing protein [Fuerstiella sp.]MCP4854510.1 prepilin-type N-terminal cleavage/methylation domain-containing protein [Fuerstiella sp.]